MLGGLSLVEIIPYDSLPEHTKNQILDVFRACMLRSRIAKRSEARFLSSLSEFGSDGCMVYTLINSLVRKGALKRGFWDYYYSHTRLNYDAVIPIPPKPSSPRGKDVSKRGNLPFSRVPKYPESREQFLTRWSEERSSYSIDMLDWNTGEINWESPVVYSHEQGTANWLVYRALVTRQNTHRDLQDLVQENLDVLDDVLVDKILIGFMIEPGKKPPGAGVYMEDKDTGKMWIERDNKEALLESRAWIRKIS